MDKETSKRVRKAAAPFLEWLKQAESEDEDEDDEEDEDEEDGADANGGYQQGDSDLDDL